jgi:hypothetical protein
MKKYYQIKQFFVCYLGQDWRCEYSDYQSATKDYLTSEQMNSRKVALEELIELRSMAEKNELFETDLYRQFGCYFIPSKENTDLVTWLTNLENQFRSSINEKD